MELAGGIGASYAPDLNQLHAPAGLDIGAETPIEIALSIIAEIRAVLTGRDGGLLRNRNGSIHAELIKRGINTKWPVSDEFGIATSTDVISNEAWGS